MTYLNAIIGVCRHQANNLVNLFRGLPISPPSLGSMTLDWDDVVLARSWLSDRSKWFEDDQYVIAFEEEFAKWNGSRYAFAFRAGRVALSACLHALQLKPGEEVIMPGYSCVVVDNAVRFAGLIPIYADIELKTYGIDVSRLKKKLTQRTKALILHHLYGLVSRDYESLIDLARTFDLKVIEDCCHSTGAMFRGKKVGNLGDVAFYSSERSKIFNTIQGGIAVTNNSELANRLREYSLQSPFSEPTLVEKQLFNIILEYYQHKHPNRWWLGDLWSILYEKKRIDSTTKDEEAGNCPITYRRRMPNPIASVGINQLRKLDHYNNIRRDNAKRWDSWCKRNGYEKPHVISHSVPVYLRYPVMMERMRKEDPSWALRELGIDLGVWFVSHLHPSQIRIGDCPNAARAVENCVNFPTLLQPERMALVDSPS